GVVGTGSSAIQSIPQIAAQARHVTVFQRTPNFSTPAHNGPADPVIQADWRANRHAYRQKARDSGFGVVAIDQREQLALDDNAEGRRETYEDRWAIGGFALLGAYGDLI